MVSGFTEQSLRTLLDEYSKNKSSPAIQRYVSSHTRKITNCKQNKILLILKDFSPEWSEKYDKEVRKIELVPNQIKDSIDSVIANRHNIAHGKDVGISLGTMTAYYDTIKKAIEILEKIIR